MENYKNIDLSKMSMSQLKMSINTIHGDTDYINTPEFKEIYQKIIAEIERRYKSK